MSVSIKGKDATPSAPKLREVLALLILRNNQLVPITDLVDELWGEHPPRSAHVTLQTYIHRLRKLLFSADADWYQCALHTGQHGYWLEIPADNIDQCQFEGMAQSGGAALEKGEPHRAAELLRHALALWRGPVMSGVEKGALLAAYAARLEESRLRALETRIEADLQLGRHRSLISELKELTITQPLHEGFHGQLMVALYRSQRRDEALTVYRKLRRRMVDEVAIEPSSALQRLHSSLLAGDVETDQPADPVVRERLSITKPAQLPNDISDFVGRAELITSVSRWLAPEEQENGPLRVVSVIGMSGVGKSAFAVRVARRLRTGYPDGQLYAKLGAADGRPRQPGDVLGSFLHAAGFTDGRIPDDLDDRATLFRTWSQNRRLLIVLDDAASDVQVQPLLPADSRCAVLITARCGLQGLAGARTVQLDPLTADEAVEMLAVVAGGERIAAEREHAERIVELCGYLPLAIRCIGARLRSTPRWPVLNMRRHLEGHKRPLDLLRFNGLDMRERLASTYQAVPGDARVAFRILPTLAGTSFTEAELASKLDCPPRAADAMLARLVGHGLLHIRDSDGGDGAVRFEFHPLTRCYAEELLSDEDEPADVRHLMSAS